MHQLAPTTLCLITALTVFGACSRQPAATPASAASPAATTPGPAASSTPAAQPAAAAVTVSGTVLETMDASNYTYVRVNTGSGEVWAASAQFKVAVGDRVVVPLESEMRNFRSKSLNRDFPLIYFATRISREGEPAQPAMALGHDPAGAAPQPPAAPVVVQPVAPPPGGMALASLWANRAALAGKSVTVRGTVVKFNAGILGRNWLHIQDGSGKASDGTNDLTITTTSTARIGDIVTVKGTVVVDKDFGSGYAYKLMLEEATISK